MRQEEGTAMRQIDLIVILITAMLGAAMAGVLGFAIGVNIARWVGVALGVAAGSVTCIGGLIAYGEIGRPKTAIKRHPP